MPDLDWYDVVIRLVVAAALGGLVGIERESDGQDAGFRTHLLLSLGSALFAVASVGAFDDFVADAASTNVTVDVSRIASYVAAGVGFLGGGAIIKYGGGVRGLTTASSLWAAAAIGLSAGLGFWSGAIAATVISLVALAGLAPLSKVLAQRSRRRHDLFLELSSDADVTATLQVIHSVLPGDLREIRFGRQAGVGVTELAIRLDRDLDAGTVAELTERLTAEVPGVRSIATR